MIEYSSAVKQAYLISSTPKPMTLTFPELTVTDCSIIGGTMRIEESLFDGEDIRFGGCNAAKFEIELAGVDPSKVIGKKVVVTQTVASSTVNFGSYTVESFKSKDEKRRRKVIAYDGLRKADIDVSAWYNALDFTSLTLKAFRESLLTHLGITYANQALANDSMIVEKTIEPAQITGRSILKAVGEVNGAFGIITKGNVFKYVTISASGETISSTSKEGVASTKEEYTVPAITKIIIREDSDDTGTAVGTNGSTYILEGNFLLFGKSSSDLTEIANNILDICPAAYVPSVTKCMGRPWVELGDTVTNEKLSPSVATCVFSRVMTGTQALKDEYSCTGNESRDETAPQHTLYEQLKSKTLKIQKSVDLLSFEMTDLEENAYSLYEQTAESIAFKVSKDEIIQQINLSTEGLLIDVSKVDIHGVVRFFSLDDYSNGASFDGGLLYSSNYFTTDTDGALVLTDGEPAETGKGSKLDLTNGTLDLKNVYTRSGTEYTNHVYLGNGTALFQGSASYSWMGSVAAYHVGQVFIEGGRIKITDFDSGTAGESIYISNEGISTTSGAESAANVIDIRSDIYEYQWDGTPRYSNALVLQSNRSPVAMRCKRGRAVINPHSMQAVYDTEHPEKSNKFSFAVNDAYETDADGDPVYTSPLAGADAGDGVIMFGRCEMQPDGSGFTVGSLGNYVGLQFSNDKDNPYVKVQQSSGTGESYADLYCRNLYCDSIASEGISEIETTLDADGRITAIEWTFENNTTATAAVTYNNDGSIASVGDTVFTVAE